LSYNKVPQCPINKRKYQDPDQNSCESERSIETRMDYRKTVKLDISKLPKSVLILERLEDWYKLPSEPSSGDAIRISSVTSLSAVSEPAQQTLNSTADSVSETKVFRCSECVLKFESLSELISHNESHIQKAKGIMAEEKKEFQTKVCHVCDFKAVTKVHLDYHMKIHWQSDDKTAIPDQHNKHTPQKEPKFECEICSKNECSKEDLLKHYQLIHKKQFKRSDFKIMKRFICTICGKRYRGEHSFKSHVMSVHLPLVGNILPLKVVHTRLRPDESLNAQGQPYWDPTLKFDCKVCHKKLGSKVKAIKHMIEEHCDAV
jgi:hypothetical protein